VWRLALLGSLLAAPMPATAGPRTLDLEAARRAAYQQQAEACERLAAWCDSEGLVDQAAAARAWNIARDPMRTYAFLPGDVLAPVPMPDDEKLAREWQDRFTEVRKQQGARLWKLASEAVSQNQASAAFELLGETLREDPDHAAARKAAGYAFIQKKWRTQFEALALREGRVWHGEFGWLPAKHVERYEQGERFTDGQWISRDEDTKRHAKLAQGWQIATEHFEISTNHSLEAGVALGEQLERLYTVWRQVFAGFITPQPQLARIFAGREKLRRSPRRHQVVYFRDKEEYRQALGPAVGAEIGITSGIYLGNERRAYFFVQEPSQGEAFDDGTLNHEATHQLFNEIRPTASDVGRRGNFWAIEGVACYMESLETHAGYYTVGGADAVRLRDAQYRYFQSQFYVPLAELCTYGMLRLQQDREIAKLYSQSAGLAHFMMHAESGKYRDRLEQYLGVVYVGRDDPTTLAQVMGMSYDQIDQQYRTFLDGLQNVSASK
jgi:hypothetical protein